MDGRIGPAVVYLDMNVWVSLTRGCARGDGRWGAARSGLEDAVSSGRIVVPLSAAHYLELWHRRDRRSREQVGAVMRELSAYATISSPYVVRRREVRGFVSQLVDRPSAPLSASDVIGSGAVHAFGSSHGRFRFVASLASPDGATVEGPAVQPTDNWDALDRSGSRWEWLQLVGTQSILESEGVERTPEHRYGTQYMQNELKLRTRLISDPKLRRQLWDFLVTDELNSLLDEINEICEEIGVDPRGFFLSGALGATPRQSVCTFVASLSSAFAWATLRYWKHRDVTHPWEQHDWTDISALSVAVPYCDAVITERRWAHMIAASGLAGRYNTQVGHGITALELLLDSLAERS